MASGIERNQDMAYVGAKPWHGLGSKLEQGAPIEQWVQAAGMDWDIKGAPVEYRFPDGGFDRDTYPTYGREIVADKQVLYRSDNHAPLGVVGDGFQIVQPREVLEFFQNLSSTAGFELETAGCLFGGKRFWAMAKTGDLEAVVPGDYVRAYLLLCTGADGSLATTGKYVEERVVCNNTLSLALREGGLQYKISHRSKFDAAAMKSALHIDEARTAFADTIQQGRMLADKFVSKQVAQGFALALLAGDKIRAEADTSKHTAILDKVEESSGYGKIISLFEGAGRGAQLDGVKDTAWGLLNAVTEYADHEVRAKSADHRMSRIIEGDADKLKAEALRLCLAI